MDGAKTTDRAVTAQQLESLLRAYFDACNAGDAKTIAACFTRDAVHYFPANERYGPWRSGKEIAEGWAAVQKHGKTQWTIDRLMVNCARAEAAVEWTQFRSKNGKRLRGVDWYVFDRDSGLIAEARAYYAADEHRGQAVHELGGFDYAARGYPMAPPPWSSIADD
ncbi:MAG: nuclear transport factor 2 family protein [Rhodospirillaceae bacterium]|nr:nuclear transport factor 2 family protein [Rhodospirillaceae bacterium]